MKEDEFITVSKISAVLTLIVWVGFFLGVKEGVFNVMNMLSALGTGTMVTSVFWFIYFKWGWKKMPILKHFI